MQTTLGSWPFYSALLPLERRTDQRAIGALGHCRGTIEAKPCQAFAVRRIRRVRKPLPQQPANRSGVRCASCNTCKAGIQPLFDLGKIAAERE